MFLDITMSGGDTLVFDHEACFFRDELDEEFYEDSLSKDLFKKFELLTPPQSPPYDPFPPDLTTNSLDLKSLGLLSDDGGISLVSNLIQDCMWSGPCLAAAGLISADSVRSRQRPPLAKPAASGGDPILDQTAAGGCTEIQTGQCVSPAAVFPCQPETVRSVEMKKCFNLGSLAETPSPSESEDEEEIDVVTVVAEKMARRRHVQSSQRVTSSLHSHLAAIHNYSNTSSASSYSAPQSPQMVRSRDGFHGYTGHKRQRPLSMPASPQPIKKQRSLLHSADLKRVVQKLRLDPGSMSAMHIRMQASRNSSDSEGDDTNKRAQHNVLERKRRNDLKYSFLRLRDHVPELSRQERTPKVTILKLSSDYIRSLTSQNKKLEKEHTKLKARHELLRQKLAALEEECM